MAGPSPRLPRRAALGLPATGRLVAALAFLLLAVTAVVAGPTAPTAPAGAADTTLRVQRTVDVTFGTRSTSTGTRERFSSPTLADLNGDDRPELVVAAPNGTITATRLDTGARLWQRPLGATEIHASPVVDDVDRNGRPDVVAATMDGRVVLLDGQSGGVIRTFRQGAPQHCPPGVDCRPDGFFATPAVADVNGDGRKDIIAPSFDHSVYAWSAGGTLLWRSFLEDTLWSSPAVVDLDRDGRPEVVLGGDIYAGNNLGVPGGGLLWALRGSNGSRFSGYPMSFPGQTIWSSPVITDLDADGSWDAVFGTGSNFAPSPASRLVHAVTLRTRAHVPGWPVATQGQVVQQPAVGDIDGDGAREVVVNTETGYLDAFEADGTRRWVTCNANDRSGGCRGYVSHSGVTIADVDDDGVQEVVATSGVEMRVYDGRDRSLEAEHRLPGSYGNLHTAAVPSIAELDGRTIIAQTAFYRVGGHTGPERGGDIVRTAVFTTDAPLCAEDWPAFKRGPRRDSVQSARAPWHPFACGRPFVAQQYRDLLGRELDAGGAAFWTARLRTTWTGPRVVRGFMNSAEFEGVAAPVVRVHLGLEAGPPGPADEIRAGMGALRQGVPLEDVARAQLDQLPPQSDAALVDAVFPRLTGRTPTTGERSAARSVIDQRGQAGWVAQLSGSSSATRHLAGPVEVAMAYIGLLDRAPEPGGWTFWVARVRAGTSAHRLIEMFLNTTEYRERVR